MLRYPIFFLSVVFLILADHRPQFGMAQNTALIDSDGVRKLEALSKQVPNLLARNSLAIGDWKEACQPQ